MQILNSLTFPLSGASLIEASAGTGKTYTIVNLYLRQLLGHGCVALNVEQILVVTFTNAATAELKERIRVRLQTAYLDFYRGSSDDDFVQSLIEQVDNIALATQRLALASKQMDEAAIFTIHGFCQRALTEHAFESGAMYEQQFVLDESEWLKLAVADYWRKQVVTQPPAIQEQLLQLWLDPRQLMASLSPLLNRKATAYHAPTISDAIADQHEYQQAVAQFKRWWLDENLAEQIQQAGFSGSAKVGKADNLNKMQAFCHSNDLVPEVSDGWLLYAPSNIEKGKKKSTQVPEVDFSRFERMADLHLKTSNALHCAFSADALSQVALNLASHKRRLQLLSPDDLLSQLGQALSTKSKEAKALALALRQRYPSVLIDEFQDTDPLQYDIFYGIYGHSEPPQSAPCWIMIGDPKQAIYGFRGADIFTYIRAKQQVVATQHFTLATNWRSTPSLVKALNTLFAHSEQGFIYQEQIPFYPVEAGKKPATLQVKGEVAASLDFWHLCSSDNKPVAKTEAQHALASYCAKQLSDLLQEGNSQVAGKTLQAGDCCVLVRNRNEAQLIKSALAAQDIASVFLVRKSVFASQVAVDCYRLLSALSQPGNDNLVKAALLTELFAMTAKEVDLLFNNDSLWQDIIALFYHWQLDWQQHGLMMALSKVISYFKLEQKAVKHFSDGLRRVTDLRHVVELLQQRSLEVQGQGQLMHWFSQCLQEPDHGNDNQQLRLETDANLVQITTLHASKGLQYPLVFIPFANSYKSSRDAVFHQDDGQLLVDFLAADKNLVLAEHERLAEDVRLIYVALTRAMYYCAVGVWHNISDDRKRRSAFAETGIGALLAAKDMRPDDQMIAQQIQALSQHADIAYQAFYAEELNAGEHQSVAVGLNSQPQDSAETKRITAPLAALYLAKPVDRHWRLTSYSALSQQQSHLEVTTPGMDEGQDGISLALDSQTKQEEVASAFSFEKGANAGLFLHGVLENCDFQQAETLEAAISQQSLKFGIEPSWQTPLSQWLNEVLHSPFNGPEQAALGLPKLCLAQLPKHTIKVEMEFYMPLKKVQVSVFNQLINHYMPQYNRHYDFAQLNGMLKGFIDLTFAFDGKYYVADYKSNHLGHDYQDYQLAEMERAMQHHDYHLQAILYTLALHRWLRQQLADYDYEQHIGGAYYLFLRGMHSTKAGNGVYYFKAPQAFILALDKLFDGQQDELVIKATEPALKPNANKAKPKDQPKTSDNANDDKGQLNLW